MKENNNKKNLLYLLLFVLACELIYAGSVFSSNNKNILANEYKQAPYLNLVEKDSLSDNNQKTLKINLREREVNSKNSFLQLENKEYMLLNFDISFGVKQFLHFHPTYEYSGVITIGNPPQEFEVIFDTGSANMIIASDACDTVACDSKRKFLPRNSTSYTELKRIENFRRDYVKNFLTNKDEVHINFGTGQIKSFMGKDRVCIGSAESSLCINDFLFLSAFEMSENPFKEVDFDGIIGLGFSDLSMSPEANFLDSLLKLNKISNKIFAFYFRKNMDLVPHDEIKNLNSEKLISEKDLTNKLSELTIGGIDFNRMNSKIHFVNVISKKYWEVKLDNIYYGNYKLPFCGGDIKCTAIVDTGTSTIGGSKAFYDAVEELAALEKSCKNLKSLKSLTFEIDGAFYELDPFDYSVKIRSVANNKFEYLVPDESNDGNSLCALSIMHIEALDDLKKKFSVVLGGPFLKKFYTIYDVDNYRLGFSLAKHD